MFSNFNDFICGFKLKNGSAYSGDNPELLLKIRFSNCGNLLTGKKKHREEIFNAFKRYLIFWEKKLVKPLILSLTNMDNSSSIGIIALIGFGYLIVTKGHTLHSSLVIALLCSTIKHNRMSYSSSLTASNWIHLMQSPNTHKNFSICHNSILSKNS